jgi:signal transduction histidine kinase
MQSYRFLFRVLGIVFIMLLAVLTTVHAQSYSSQEFKSKYLEEKNYQKKFDYFFKWIERNSESKKNIEYLEEVIFLSDSLKLYSIEAKALHLISLEWKKRGEYADALNRLNQALSIYTQSKDIPNLNSIKLDIADIYRCLNRFQIAFDILNETIEFYINHNDTKKLAYIYNRYAANYLELFYNCDSYQIFHKDSASSIEQFLIKIDSIPELKKNYKKVLYYIKKSNVTAHSIADTTTLISNLIIKGQLEIVCFGNQEGINTLNEAIFLMDRSGIDIEKPLVLINKARVLGIYRLNKPEEAVQIAEKALEIAQQKQIRIYIFMASNVLHENYYALKNYEKAYIFLKKSHDIFNIFRDENLLLKMNSSSFEKKINQIENKVQAKKFQQKILIIIILGISVFSFIIIILMMENQKKQKKLMQDLKEKSTIIFNQNNDLQIVISEKDKLFSIIGHDLKTPFNSILGFAELITEEYDQLTKDEILTYCQYIVKSSNKTLNLLENLLVWAKLLQNRIVFAPKEIQLYHIVHEIELMFNEILIKKSILLENEVSENSIVFADEEMLKTIFRNLIGNAIKFSNIEGKIIVSSILKPEGTEITVTDFGVGISKQNIEKLYQFNSQFITIGTENEKGSGLGLIICKDMIEKHGGYLRIESDLNVGSKFIFMIPNMNNLIK